MPNVNTSFAGQTLVIPGAYYADNVSAVGGNNQTGTPPLVFIGYGYGQEPFVPVTYDNSTDLLSAIRGGPCSGYVPFLTNPSGQLNGAQQITFIEVGDNTQSTKVLNSGTSGVINLTSTDYGLPSNLLQISVDTGSVSGKAVTLFDGYSGVTATQDNLGVPFQLAYTGASSGVSYTVTTSGGAATNFSTSSPVSGESVSISLDPSNYGTISQVIDYLNGTGFYSAISLGNGDLPSSNLDNASAIALASGVPIGAYVPITATLGDIVYWVNNQAQGLATAAIASGITSSPAVAPDNIPLTPFQGATSVPPTLSNYASGFNVALTIPGWSVFADSNSSGVVALGTQHANTASEPVNGKWRRFFTGSSIGDAPSDAQSAARSCNSNRVSYVYPGIYRVDDNTGVNTLYSGHTAAAAAAGMATGNAVATPLTNKSLNGTGVERKLTVSQIDQLQQAGVMPLWIPQQTGVPTIVSDLTTWQNDNNPENVFNQQIACRDYLAYSTINVLAPYVGTQADPITETRILNAVKAMLNALLYNSGNANGVLVDWDPKTLKLVYNGTNQLAAISVSVVFVGQNRFITAYVNVLPLSIVLAAA